MTDSAPTEHSQADPQQSVIQDDEGAGAPASQDMTTTPDAEKVDAVEARQEAPAAARGQVAGSPAESAARREPASHTFQALGALFAGIGRDMRRVGRAGRRLLPRRRPRKAAETATATAAPAPRRRRGFARAVFAMAVLLVGGLAAMLAWALHDAPFAAVAQEARPTTVLLQSADGDPLIGQGPHVGRKTGLEEYPDHLIDAVLAIEDRRFYEHAGIDLRGIARAGYRNLFAGEVVEGGSTITQQLLKVRHLDRSRTFKRKVQEAALAFYLESRLSKDEILASYLNTVYLGAGATGMTAAARVYFNKEVGDLGVSESAMLAGLIRAPSWLNPLQHPERAEARAAVVLSAMEDAGRLSPEERSAAAAEPAVLDPARVAATANAWFADWAMAEAEAASGSFSGNVTIRTTLDPVLQSRAQEVVLEALERGGDESGVSQAALVALDADGAVRAMVGGRDYAENSFNRAVQARRQPGSTFKAFVYYAALEAGVPVGARIVDEPIEIDGWEPKNFDGRHHGQVPIPEAFARSLNVPAVVLAHEIGVERVVEAAETLGIASPLQATPSLALGTSETSLLEMTAAYAALNAGAAPVRPQAFSFLETEEGARFNVGGETARTELGEAADIMRQMMRLVVEQGTGQAARIEGVETAGKTGTSQEFKDAWFIGFAGDLTVGVWVGNDDGTPMNEVTGGKLPAEIWRDFMIHALDRTPADGFEGSDGLVVEAEAVGAEAVDAEMVSDAAPFPGESVENEPMGDGGAFEGGQMAGYGPGPQTPMAGGAMQCNYDTCARFYRSFRASDCTYQPYSGSRRVCTR